MKKLAAMGSMIASLIGCSGNSSAEDKRWQAVVDEVVMKCGLPKGSFAWANGNLKANLENGMKYDAVQCALDEFRRRRLPMKQGFIGEESSSPED